MIKSGLLTNKFSSTMLITAPIETAAGSGSSTTAPPPPAIASTTATWSVAGGSLANSVTFESFDHYGDDHYKPLVLYPPPSSDSPPCDITVTFSGKQRLRNVNLRSTARAYEIYCAPELGSSSEYLCTLCCVALRDERVLLGTGVEDEGLDDGKRSSSSSGGDLSGDEDGWVEVKAHDALDRNSQDLYQATVEIIDANPCTSITLKLLSLQDKGHVHVDEIYVYADPVDTVNPGNGVGSMESAAGSSVMAMLKPGFFELSRAKGVGGAQDKCSIDAKETEKSEEVASEATDTVNAASEIPQVASLEEADPILVQMPKVSGTEEGSKKKLCCSRTEGVLDLLCYRVSVIEDLVFRLEESMLKPMHSINERLQRLEHQVEVLTKKPEISVPDSSCTDSESKSFDMGNQHSAYNSAEANKKVSPSNVLSVSSDESPALVNATAPHPGLVTVSPGSSNCDSTNVSSAPEFPSLDASSVSANSTKLHPGLVITAPEFSNCDEEENHVEEPVNGSSPGPEQEHHAIKSPELPNVEDDSNDKAGSQRVHFAIPSDPSTSIGEPDGIENHPPESEKASPKQNQNHSLSFGALAGFLASLMGQGHSETHKPSENNNGEKEEHSQITADHSSSVVETPTVDVQSLSLDRKEGGLLESSLDGMQDWNKEVSSGEESCDDVYDDGDQINLLSIEDWDAFALVSDDDHIPVDTN